MGNWAIVVHGHGIHDNGRDDDADALMARFVDDLRAKGHIVSDAVFTAGCAKGMAAVAGNSAAQWKSLP